MMILNRLLVARVVACAVAGVPGLAGAWQPGTYPVPPERMWTGDFGVDNQDRNDVVAFWHAVFQASEGYETRIKWTGNYSGTNGTTSGAFLDDVERRTNYFRAMCGVSSDTRVNTDSKVSIAAADPYKP